jgi:hypothetical protein
MSGAGVIVTSKFVSPGKKYAGYLAYIDRADAKTNWRLDEAGAGESYGGFLGYMDRTAAKKKSGDVPKDFENKIRLFTANSDRLDAAAKKKLKRIYDDAEKNGSLLWECVMSFETPWLRDTGLYDPLTRDVNDSKLIEYSRAAITALLDKEGFSGAVWAGEIHKNKPHFHIHFSFVDPNPSWTPSEGRCRIDSNGELYQRGKLKLSSLTAMKSTFVNLAVDYKDENIRISEIIRSRILPALKARPVSDEFAGAFYRLLDSLPSDMRLWKYGNNAMKKYLGQIDDISSLFIEKNCRDDYDELVQRLHRQQERYAESYGEKSNHFAEEKIKDLYSRLGNLILAEARQKMTERRNTAKDDAPSGETQRPEIYADFADDNFSEQAAFIDTAIRHLHVQTEKTGKKIKRARIRYAEFDRSLSALKKLMRKDIQKAKNQAAYQKLNKDTEREI